MSKKLIVVCGPTAIGKTALGIKLANHFNTEVISADSRQFYKELEIGTAKPDAEELVAAKHHFVNNLSIYDDYSAGDFERDVLQFLEKFFENHDTAVMVGGSGLFVRAVLQGLDEFPEVPKEVRLNLEQELKTHGIEVLQQELLIKDPELYHSMEIKNSQRLKRALEVCRVADKPFSYYKNKSRLNRDFEPVVIGLNAERDFLYERINRRVDIMVAAGLVEEAQQYEKDRDLYALKTVGYQELMPYFDDEISLDSAIELIKRNTRRFAKRQITWFKKEEGISWFLPDDFEGILEYINKDA